MPEILSPVGNRAMLEAAVRSGADAVYMGMSDFNARRTAVNFGKDEFRDAVEYCHVRGVRVYLTLNTLVSDDELPRALETAVYAYEVGADAVIVQDFGLARLIHETMPDFPLHASTQMTIHSPSALRLLKSLGFCQVVVSREMSKDELSNFCKTARDFDIKVEVFVHGALCMCMSGQCYLSALIGGRSGNRGLCAGPCRLPFSADGKEAYALSLKDLSLVEHLDELTKMGVSSFKIEGRLKRPEYVAAATAVCRKILDGESCEEWKAALSMVFSRGGFTEGYYTAKRNKDMFGVRGYEDVLISAKSQKKIHELYRSERQNIAIAGKLSMEKDIPVQLWVSDGVHEVAVSGQVPQSAVENRMVEEDISQQVKKTGNTPFYFSNLQVVVDDGLFYPVSLLNALRREALEKLSLLRGKSFRSSVNFSNEKVKHKVRNGRGSVVAKFLSLSQVPGNLENIDAIVLPLEERWEEYRGSAELLIDIPRGIESEAYIYRRLLEAKVYGVKGAFCGNLSAAALALDVGLAPIFDYSMNLFSSSALQVAAELGARASVFSFEALSTQYKKSFSTIPCGVYAYGRLPLMLMRNCPVKAQTGCDNCKYTGGLVDRMGAYFPVRCRLGYSEMLNSTILWIADKLDNFSADFYILNFTTETVGECASVLKSFFNREKPKGDFTRGLYFRGVM